MDIPTPISAPLNSYNKQKEGLSGLQKHKALESVFQALIKYVSITLLLIAKDTDKETYAKSLQKVALSSSLGGWVDAIECIKRDLKFQDGKESSKSYIDFLFTSKRNPENAKLIALESDVNNLADIMNVQGYRIEHKKSINIHRIFKTIVELRNKCAHGNISIVTTDKLIKYYERILKSLIYLLPLDTFTLYGQFNNRSYRLVGTEPVLKDEICRSIFWVESNLLNDGYSTEVPLMQYQFDTQEVYFLNDAISDEGASEFINYKNGNVRFWNVDIPHIKTKEGIEVRKNSLTKINSNRYDLINSIKEEWIEVPLSTSSIDLLPTKGKMIYTFCVKPKVNNTDHYDMLYVGQSIYPRERFKDYLKIYNGYDLSRIEISAMFNKYEDNIIFSYILIRKGSQLSEVETAFYEIFNPPYNLVAPSAIKTK